MSLTIDKYSKADDSIVQVMISGSLDTETSAQFDQFVETGVSESSKIVVINMKNLEYISSAGIRSIFKLAKRVKKNNGKIAAVNRQPQVSKVFEIVKALPDMEIFRDNAELDEYLIAMQEKVLKDID